MATEKFTFHRRGLFSAAAAAALGGMLGLGRREASARGTAAQTATKTNLVSAARIDGIDGGAVWSADGLSDFTLPGRAHAVVRLAESDRVMLVGRRPGMFAAIVDPVASARAAKLVSPVPHFRFAGHAAVGAGGVLVTSELHEETAEAIAVGIGAGYLVGVYLYGIDPVYSWYNMLRYTEAAEVVVGLIKALIFGGIVALIGCYKQASRPTSERAPVQTRRFRVPLTRGGNARRSAIAGRLLAQSHRIHAHR